MVVAILIFALVASMTFNAVLLVRLRPEERGYRPCHIGHPADDELVRSMSARRRDLRRSPAPWAARGVRDPIPLYPKET